MKFFQCILKELHSVRNLKHYCKTEELKSDLNDASEKG